MMTKEQQPGSNLHKTVTRENVGAARFIIRLGFFAAPFLVYVVMILAIDPYNFFDLIHLVSDDVKKPISNLHYPLWKMPEYRRNPQPNILLGDSRMGAVRPELIEEISGDRYYNFSYGGATLEEVIRTFWFADSLTSLEKVSIGVNFNLYNGIASGDRTEDYRNIRKNSLLYFVHPSVCEATWQNIRALCGANVTIGVPKMSRDQFWRYQLETTATRMYRRYEYPTDYRKGLVSIAEHCKTNGIQLTFIVFPTHTDLQQRVLDFGLAKEYQTFVRDLSEMAPTYDFDSSNEYTRDRENFKDPFHLKEDIMRLLVQAIWGNGSALPVAKPKVFGPSVSPARSGSGRKAAEITHSFDSAHRE